MTSCGVRHKYPQVEELDPSLLFFIFSHLPTIGHEASRAPDTMHKFILYCSGAKWRKTIHSTTPCTLVHLCAKGLFISGVEMSMVCVPGNKKYTDGLEVLQGIFEAGHADYDMMLF